MNEKEPPVALVRTWVELLKLEDAEIKKIAAEKMIAAFGSIKDAAEFCSKNGINMK